MNKSRRETLPYLIEKISILNIKRTNYIYSLLHGKEMIHGMPHEVLRKCGKKTCKCNSGTKHGPYPALSVNKQGRQKIVMIKKADATSVLSGAERYKHFQQTLARIRRIDKEINNILVKLKTDTTTDYMPG
jgi:hypothetical protein